MHTYNRERIPERVVHAKGSAAYGMLTVNNPIPQFTRSAFLDAKGESECFLRFSTVAGERGTTDAERDIKACQPRLLNGNCRIFRRPTQPMVMALEKRLKVTNNRPSLL